jgi:hypothetical protein
MTFLYCERKMLVEFSSKLELSMFIQFVMNY